MIKENLIELININYAYGKQLVLKNINLLIKSGEITAIVGKSGTGKSTLLRIIAGLLMQESGEIKIHTASPPTINMVFQTIALFPWLNVLDNITIGLLSQNLLTEENSSKVKQIIHLLELDGFEQAMPKELSGDMKQRVSLSRGLSMSPDILLLDEPFTNLDVLTSNNLKQDLIKLWETQLIHLKSIVLVTHSIEEALSIADRVIVLAHSPAQIVNISEINLVKPRDPKSQEFQNQAEIIFSYMLGSMEQKNGHTPSVLTTWYSKLPEATVNDMSSLAKLLVTVDYNNKANINELAKSLNSNIDKIMQIIEGLVILKFATIIEDDIELTKDGELFGTMTDEEQKKLFTAHLLQYAPLSEYILQIINARNNHTVHKERFKSHLEDYMSTEEANISLNTIINWGRFAQLFAYDDKNHSFYIQKASH